MRYYNYLTESKDIDYAAIVRDCGFFFSNIQWGNFYLYRGMKNNNKMVKKDVRTDRHPLDSSLFLHTKLNEIFNELYGVNLRSSSLFATGDYKIAKGYGKLHLIFPIGKFDYYWSQNIRDLFIDADDMWISYDNSMDLLDEYMKELKSMISKNYNKNGSLISAITSKHEIMITCKNYYAVRVDSFDDVADVYSKLREY